MPSKAASKAKPRAEKASGEVTQKRNTKTKAQKAEDAIDKALKTLKKPQREQVLSNYVGAPAVEYRTPRKVESSNENLDNLERVWAAYRAGSEPTRAVESALQKLFPHIKR